MRNLPAICERRSLHTLYGDSHILHGISFDIAAGQTGSPSLEVAAAQWHDNEVKPHE